MSRVLYADETGCAIFNESYPGDQAPFNDPVNHAADVFFHDENDYYSLAQAVSNVTINHPSIPVATDITVFNDTSVSIRIDTYYTRTTNDYHLVTHSLGYPPLVMVLDSNGFALPNGFPIQTNTGGHRSITIYATSTDIRLSEICAPGNAVLGAISKIYTVYVFRLPAIDPLKPTLEIDVPGGSVIFGQGKFDLTKLLLRRIISGETADIQIPAGRMTDVDQGCTRFAQANGTMTDINGNGHTYGGSFTGSSHIDAKVV